jgi:hypothetical protein
MEHLTIHDTIIPYTLEPEFDMNCIPETDIPKRRRVMSAPRHPACSTPLVSTALLLAICALPGCGVSTSESATQTPPDKNSYRLEFVVTPDRAKAGASVELKLTQSRRQLRELRMRIDSQKISDLRGDGELVVADDTVTWIPTESGGSLRWFASLRQRRNSGAYDAYLDADWAVFRGEDIIPRATTRTLKGASSETWLSFSLPLGWSSATPYYGHDHRYRIDIPDRRFDLPGGWMALGKIGVRNETIAGVRVKIAAPEGQGVRRMDMMAMLQWTLPEVVRLLPAFPERLTIVSAGDPMWRGGLSGPQSLFIHASRPLISENATSTLLHEVIHVGFGVSASANADWIVEGLAEYYSLRLLARSGTISDRRLKQALVTQAEWGATTDNFCTSRSTGAVTAKAVTLLAALDGEIRKATKSNRSLDDVIGALASSDNKITLEGLRATVTEIAGKPAEIIAEKNLPGCLN